MGSREEQYEELLVVVQQLREENKVTEELNQLLDRELASAQEEKAQVQQQLATAQNQVVMLKEQVAKLRKENADLENQLEKTTKQKDLQLAKLQEKFDTLCRAKVELENDLETESKKNRELLQANKDLESEYGKLIEDYHFAQADLENTRTTLQDQIHSLQQQLKDSKEDLFVARHQRLSLPAINEFAKMPTIDTVRQNAAGFNKSLTLISALIKDLDEKMCLIRHQKV